jgi:hypothetical protein
MYRYIQQKNRASYDCVTGREKPKGVQARVVRA